MGFHLHDCILASAAHFGNLMPKGVESIIKRLRCA
jgi:hypothetical protein